MTHSFLEEEDYRPYLFDYEYVGSERAIEILAISPEEVRERIGAMPLAT
jgi:hypothetical protein